ncbi:MAG: hypothetical protein C0492_04745 [Verminephrobacter sp.]|nr:hypothetical protein [Verminephrobacter sp.]
MKTLACCAVRHTNRRAMIQTVVAVLLAPALTPAHAQLAVSTAINRTGRFRAMSQRIAKVYSQIHLNVLPDQSRTVLTTARQLVHSGFEDLAKVQWPADLTGMVADVKKQADTLESLLVIPPTRESVAAVAAQSDKMMAAAQATTEAFEKFGKTGTAKLVNMAGRQRALSQRLAKNYFLVAAKLESKGTQDQMKADATEFRQAMSALAAAPISTPSIRNELALGDSQWLFFDAALQRKPDDRSLETVGTTSERLLEVMDRLTGLYDAALKEVLG